MIQSIYVLNNSGTVLIEKHYRGTLSRAVADLFTTEISRAGDDVRPVLSMGGYVLINIHCGDLYYLSVVQKDVEPLLVIEFLEHIHDTFSRYFDVVNEEAIKDHFVTVYELLDEMADNGMPFTTEPNVLTKLIHPPTIFDSLDMGKTATEVLPDGQLSNIPWRRIGAKYTNNEFFLDIIEEIDAIIGANSMTISSEINGRIECNCRLSGMPDLTLLFANASILDDVSFHPCVRYVRWQNERVVSFVPPDGKFELMTYRVHSNGNLPLSVKPQISYSEGSGRVTITVGTRPMSSSQEPVEGIVVTIPFPKTILSTNLTATHGTIEYDEMTKTSKWTLGKIPSNAVPMVEGSVVLPINIAAPESNPNVSVDFKIDSYAVSGLRVEKLEVMAEKYKPWKGVQKMTKAGTYEVRC